MKLTYKTEYYINQVCNNKISDIRFNANVDLRDYVKFRFKKMFMTCLDNGFWRQSITPYATYRKIDEIF